MSTSERPGVYTSYEISNVLYSGVRSGVCGIAAEASVEISPEIFAITSYQAAVSKFGAGSHITELIGVLIKNGAARIKAVPITISEESPAASLEDYSAAFALLAAEEDVKTIVCDTVNSTVHTALKNSIVTADQKTGGKIGVVESGGTVESAIAAARNINCERMVMVSPQAVNADGTAALAGTLAAAVAAAIVSESDPALPLNGAELFGLGGVDRNLTDGDMTLLIEGGVTPVESRGGAVFVIRGITTKTATDGSTDYTWRELTTVRIVDDVIPTVRDALKTAFSRTKNTAQTRDAIKTRVIIELEKKIAAEIIEDYGNVTVVPDETDPTVCLVTFEFTVAHGLNQIRLTAYITV